MLVALKGLFTPQAIAQNLEALPDIPTTIMDAVFPQRPTHPFPSVGVSDLVRVTGTIPVVRRAGQPYSMGGDGLDIQIIAPRPLKPSINVTAAELNDLQMILQNAGALAAWQSQKIDMLRRAVRETTEAMASVVLTTGKVSWPSQLDGGGLENYEVDYGPVLTVTPDSLLAASSKVSELYTILVNMRQAVRRQGYGGNVEFFAGTKVFGVIMDMAQAYSSTSQGSGGLRVDLPHDKQGVVTVGGFKITLMDETYQTPGSDMWVDKLSPASLLGYAVDAPGKIWYCAIDSISAKNAATPFHIIPEVLPGDSGYQLIAQSKPLPARNPKTIVKAVVVA